MKKTFLALILTVMASAAGAQGYGPGSLPSPWRVNGSTLSYPGCITLPASVSCMGNGTINASGIYLNGTSLGYFATGTDASHLTGTMPALVLPTPTATTLGGVESATAPANQFQTGINTSGVLTFAQPAFSNLSGVATTAQLPIGTSGATIPLLNGANTWSAQQNFNGSIFLPNNKAVYMENAATTASLPVLFVDASNNLNLGYGGTPSVFGGAVTAPGLKAPSGGISGAGWDTNGANLRLNSGATATDFLIRNDGTSTWFMFSNTAGGGYNSLQPIQINDTTGQITFDNAGAGAYTGTRFGGGLGVGAAPPDANYGVAISTGVPASTASTLYNNAGALSWNGVPVVTGSAISVAVKTRQTVMGGPQASGAPSIFPATSASLTLTTQNIGSGANAMTVTAAQGFGSAGNVDYVYQFTANQSWTLAANTTTYLYVNAQTGALGQTTLQPIYQFGGTPSTVNGQFTFDYQAMIGYMGNGTSAAATPVVFVGEAVTGASSVTSTVAYAYNGYYDSGWTATLPAASTAYSSTSNLGVSDAAGMLIIQCTAADGTYAIGDQMTALSSGSGVTFNGSLWENRLALGGGTAASGNWSVNPKTGGSAVGLTNANWKYKLVHKRNW